MAKLSENFTIEELCEWLKTEDGKKFLKIVKSYGTVYGSQFQISGLSKGAMDVFVKEFQDIHEELSNVAKSKPIAAKVYLADLKRVLPKLKADRNFNHRNGRKTDDDDLRRAVLKVAPEKDWNDAEATLLKIAERVESL